eukprot:325759-Lingulodinium_polyedra.AAC.1
MNMSVDAVERCFETVAHRNAKIPDVFLLGLGLTVGHRLPAKEMLHGICEVVPRTACVEWFSFAFVELEQTIVLDSGAWQVCTCQDQGFSRCV